MAQIDSVQAALFAFKKRERAFVLAGATAGYLLVRVAIGAAFIALTWPLWNGLIGWYLETLGAISNGREPAAPPTGPLLAIAPWLGVSAIAGLVLFAAYEAACLRWLVRGESSGGLLGLNLGADTWRVFAIYWIWWGMGLAFVIGVGVLYLALNALSGLHQALQIAAMLLGALAPLGLLALLIWAGVRLSPAAALSIAYKRLSFFGAWNVTRGQFWPLLGAFALTTVGYLIIASIAQALMRIPFSAKLAPAWSELVLGGGSAENFIATLREMIADPVFVALGAGYMLVSVILACLLNLTLFGVNAAAVRASQEARAGPAPASA